MVIIYCLLLPSSRIYSIFSNTPLHFCAGYGHHSCTKALLYSAEHQSYELNLSAMNSKGDTPLHMAAKYGFLENVKLLVEYGASTSVKNQNGEKPSDVAHDIVIKNCLLS